MHNWCSSLTLFQKLVCKVDQLVKRRAKSGLIRVNVDWSDAKEFINQHLGKEIKVRFFFFKCRLRIFYFRLIKKSQSGISWNLTKLSKNRWDWYLFIEVFKKVKNQLLVLKENEPNFFGCYKLCIWLLHELFSFCYKLSIWNLVHIFLKSWDSSPFKSIQVMVHLHTFARNEIIGKICNQTMLERTLVYCMFDLVWPVLNEASSR